MKLPKTKKRYCPKCKKHTEHTVAQAKKKTPGSVHTLSHGSKRRQKLRHRGVGIGTGNKGRYSRKAISKFKMTGAKPTKKSDLRYKCKECGKMHMQKKGFRSKKLEIK